MVFGKTMESVSKRLDLELVTNQSRAKKLIAKPTIPLEYHQRQSCIGYRTDTENNRRSTDLSGYLYFGIVKVTMYKFRNEEILCKYGSRAKLACTDTDSFIYHILTNLSYHCCQHANQSLTRAAPSSIRNTSPADFVTT